MKIVFLDFDGPIIPLMSHKPSRRNEMEKAWPPCVAALNRITDTTGAKIVVSSTWRADGVMKTKDRLTAWGVTAPIIGLTPHLWENPELFCGHKARGLEIAAFIESYEKRGRGKVESFVILDDDADMEHLLPFLIQTPFDIGLTEADADKAIDMLNANPTFGGPNGQQ